MILGYTFYQIAWYFAVYSFIGWCVEVVYCTVTSGEIVNRGFLNGPVCPIYGFGMIAVLILLKMWNGSMGEANIIELFLGGMFLASAVELLGGWLMLKLFHARWWDYSDKPFNIGGYICLEFSIIWGVGAVGVIRIIQPIVAQAANVSIPTQYGWPILGVVYSIYLVDLIVTICTVIGLNRDLKELDKVRASLRVVSDTISNGLGTSALETDRRIDEGKLQATLAKAEARDAIAEARSNAADAVSDAKASAADTIALAKSQAVGAVTGAKQTAAATAAQTRAALEAHYEAVRQDILGKRHIGGGRLLKAFPDMKHSDYRDIVSELSMRLTQKK